MSAGARPERPIEADWLALRRPLDDAAREPARELYDVLAAWLPAAPGPVEVFDLGAGTGANQAHLAGRLPFETRWTLLDHDPALLSHPGQGPGRRVLAGIEELPGLLAESARERPPAARVVTCSALLDLLATSHLDELAKTLHAAAVPGLFALTVTGVVDCEPRDDGDQAVRGAFDAHQARGDRPGPGASAYLAAACRALGARVLAVPTPWHIDTAGAAVRPFARRWLRDRAGAAAEHDPGAAWLVDEWLARRLDQVDRGSLRAVVGHEDLLVLPGRAG